MLRGRVPVPLLVGRTNLGQWPILYRKLVANWPGAKWKKVRGLEPSNPSSVPMPEAVFYVRLTHDKTYAEFLKREKIAYDLGAGETASCSWIAFSNIASGSAPLMKIPLMKNPGVPLTPARMPSWLSC